MMTIAPMESSLSKAVALVLNENSIFKKYFIKSGQQTQVSSKSRQFHSNEIFILRMN